MYLDARSAFDLLVIAILLRRQYIDGIKDDIWNYLDQRHKNRITYIKWDQKLLGPIHDNRGGEQGGINVSDLYRTYNREQLTTSDMTGLGAYIGSTHIAAIGQADDVALISTSPYALISLAKLTVLYYQKYFVQLAEEKTQIFKPSKKTTSNYFEIINLFSINNTPAEIVQVAEHVGIQRGTLNNTPSIDDRFIKHRNSLYGLLGAGISLNHRANPAAALRAHATFCHPVLLSGLPALILTKDEITRIHKHHKKSLQHIQKFYHFQRRKDPGS